jgi:predicted ATP-dependent Lon-type protease
MNLHFKDVFRGKVVNKRLTFNTRMDEFPRYVLEYLIDNYLQRGDLRRGLRPGEAPPTGKLRPQHRV